MAGPQSGKLQQPGGSSLPTGASESISGDTFGGYLVRTAATTVELQALYGNRIGIGTATEFVEIATLTDAILDVADNLLTAAGADSGAAMAPSTLYYVYVSDSQVAYQPLSVRASATAPTRVKGVYYLGAAGDAARWRFVGWVRTNATGANGNFVDSITQRFVINFYNRRNLSLFSCPGYVDDNAATTYSVNSANWTPANGGTGSKLEFIANGEDEVHIEGHCSVTNAGNNYPHLGIGVDSTTTAFVEAVMQGQAVGQYLSCSIGRHYQPSAGYKFLELLMATSGAVTYIADDARNGGASDPAVTFITATVRG